MRKWPSSFDTVSSWEPDSWFCRLIVTAGTAAPDSSLTVPARPPVPVCAGADQERRKESVITHLRVE